LRRHSAADATQLRLTELQATLRTAQNAAIMNIRQYLHRLIRLCWTNAPNNSPRKKLI